MNKDRMEAFSDGVIAIIITIMVVEMKAPHGVSWAALQPVLPDFLSYVLSFAYLGIYWNNHHHLLKAVKYVDGRVLWANLHLLFWLSLFPFTTHWMGGNQFARAPVILYGINLFLAAVAYLLLVRALLKRHGKESLLAKAMGNDFKGMISAGIYLMAILWAFTAPLLACGLYALVALLWIVPDQRVEKLLKEM